MSMDLAAIRRLLHRRPETGLDTYETAKTIMSCLDDLGVPSKTCAGTGVVAEIEGTAPGPTVAVRVDIDALPVEDLSGVEFASERSGKAHACGHDAHAAIGIGVAEALMGRRAEIAGRARLIFQPAEETFQGARAMVECGALDGVQAIFGVHNMPTVPLGSVVFVDGSAAMAASDRFRITVKGMGGHAGMPHQTRDPLVACAAVIMSLQAIVSRAIDPSQSATVSVCRMSGGTAFNVIGDSGELEGTARYLEQSVGESIADLVQSIARSTARAHRCEADTEYAQMVPPLMTSPKAVRVAMGVAADILGASKIQRSCAFMGSEDFALYAARIPASYFWVGSQGPYPLHSPRFVIDEGCIRIGVDLMTEIAIRAGRIDWLSPRL
ncbi:MAG: M20 family metallopeptidase [Clostridia bacterium]|nr:M20 family metallopeptidase [Clostridia bacterium]